LMYRERLLDAEACQSFALAAPLYGKPAARDAAQSPADQT
jgi:hypothetical protein